MYKTRASMVCRFCCSTSRTTTPSTTTKTTEKRRCGDAILFTIGNSTRTVGESVALLRMAEITLVVDVRSIPRSRAVPQFNADTLADSLAAEGIGYRHLRVLGGRRPRRKA